MHKGPRSPRDGKPTNGQDERGGEFRAQEGQKETRTRGTEGQRERKAHAARNGFDWFVRGLLGWPRLSCGLGRFGLATTRTTASIKACPRLFSECTLDGGTLARRVAVVAL